MNRRTIALLLALVWGCGPGGGQGTDSGNALTASLTVTADGAAVGGRDVASISVALMTLQEAEFEGCEGEDAEIDYPGPDPIDLLANQGLGEIELSFETVCELEFAIGPGPADFAAEPRLAGTTLYVEGTTNTGASFVLSSAGEWEFEAEEQMTLTEALNTFVLLFDTDVWFDGLDPDDGVAGADGTIVIDADTNADLLAIFEANVIDSASLAGEVEDDEDDG
jgi:hypothetical protein